jgi:hypothetical protein
MTVTLPQARAYELRPPECVNLADQDDGQLGRGHLSNSALNTYLACEQRFDFHYEQRLEPTVQPKPLAMGRAFAHALELGEPEAGETMLLEQAIEQAEEATGNPWLVVPDPEDVQIQSVIVREAARCYLNRYGRHDQTREVELRARVRNPKAGGRYSLSHDLLGRVDAVSEDWRTLFEDKLVGQIPRQSLAARLRLDRQVSIECYLIWRCTGVMVEDVKYRLTLKPAIRRRQGESHDGYLDRIAAEYRDRPDHYLHEEPASRTHDDFLRLEQELWRWAERVRESRRDGTWPRNTAACHDFGGCRFVALCSGEPGAEHQFRVRAPDEILSGVSGQPKETG